MKIHDLKPAAGSRRDARRVGRGIGGKGGKTAGRGTKGQKARGQVPASFEGGQMPLHMRMPKRGFNNIFAKKYNELNLGRVQKAIDEGTLDGKKPITIEALKEAGLIRRAKDGVRLLGHGELKAKLAFEVTGASASAIKAVESAGGSVTLKSITGREAPAADKIKADKRAAKRAAVTAAAEAKSGKPKAKAEAAEGEEAAKPAKAAKADAAPKKPKTEDGEAKKAKPAAAKKDKS